MRALCLTDKARIERVYVFKKEKCNYFELADIDKAQLEFLAEKNSIFGIELLGSYSRFGVGCIDLFKHSEEKIIKNRVEIQDEELKQQVILFMNNKYKSVEIISDFFKMNDLG